MQIKVTKDEGMTIEAFGVANKMVRATGNSAHVLVPKAWVGKEVTVILLEPEESGSDKTLEDKYAEAIDTIKFLQAELDKKDEAQE